RPPPARGHSLRGRHGRDRRPRPRRPEGLSRRDPLLRGAPQDEACLLHRPRRPVCGSVGCRLPFLLVRRVAGALSLLALALALAGCSGGGGRAGAAVKAKPACPPAKGWQQLADTIRAPVYCPRWMPDP